MKNNIKNKVYLVKISDDDIGGAMYRLFNKLEFKLEFEDIAIKINMCDYRKRETGVTTDPLILEPLLKYLRNKYPNSKIYLIENDATGTLCENLYEWLGIDTIAEKFGAQLINLADQEWVPISIKGYHFNNLEIPKILMESTIINHPKLKTHGRTIITCGLKNMYACYKIKNKINYHSFLDNAIVDINMGIKTHYTIVDGYLCLEGNRGPTQGYPKKGNILLGGNDIVAVDAFCAKTMGINHRLVRHIVLAQKKNIGSARYLVNSELNKQEIKNLKFEFSYSKFVLMQILRRLIK